MKRQIDKNLTKQLRIESELHYQLKMLASTQKTTLKTLSEEFLWDGLQAIKEKNAK